MWGLASAARIVASRTEVRLHKGIHAVRRIGSLPLVVIAVSLGGRNSGIEGYPCGFLWKGLGQRTRHYYEPGLVLAVCGHTLMRTLDHAADTLWLQHRFDHVGHLAGQFVSEPANDAQ